MADNKLAAPTKMGTIKEFIEKRGDALASLIPKHLDSDRLLKVALNCISKTPALQDCTPLSLLQCIITATELGLEPGGALGHAYLVPFGNVCTLIVGYRGLIELMRRSGQLASIRSVVVHEKDQFEWSEGIDQTIVHKPYLEGDAGKLRFVYCVAKLKDGSIQAEPMSLSQVEAIRARSRSGKSGPWVTDYEEMAKKTVVRRIAKYLPMSPEVAKAFEVDNGDYVEGEVVDPRDAGIGAAVVGQLMEGTATQRAKAKAKKSLQIVDVPSETPPPPPAMTDEEKAAAVAAEKAQAEADQR